MAPLPRGRIELSCRSMYWPCPLARVNRSLRITASSVCLFCCPSTYSPAWLLLPVCVRSRKFSQIQSMASSSGLSSSDRGRAGFFRGSHGENYVLLQHLGRGACASLQPHLVSNLPCCPCCLPDSHACAPCDRPTLTMPCPITRATYLVLEYPW